MHFNKLSFFRVRVMVVVVVGGSPPLSVLFDINVKKQNKRKFFVCLLAVEFHCTCHTDLHQVRIIYQFHF